MNTLQDFYQTPITTTASTSPQVEDFLFNPDMLDDWLAEELCQSGIALINSPPVSPISDTTPKKKLILPKTLDQFPRIAPRPILIQPQSQPIIIKKAAPKKRPLTEKEQDEITLKRQKNTDAARRSRLKKLLKMEHLEIKVNELESSNNHLNTRIAVLESEKFGLQSKTNHHEDRIKVLEAQLAEAHRALTKIT